ncbi:hypothetical protein [uncultured Roseobacter sp.]|uniref:hypothetical protein n=1 Tax=uncultured Roseobacter sp. TaxID=114847 RepID=UPI00262C02BB|nr:hypothetical protein [uncultured Roseobacter sp.]
MSGIVCLAGLSVEAPIRLCLRQFREQKTAKFGKRKTPQSAPVLGGKLMTQNDFETRFAPVFALKAVAGSISREAKRLKSQERQRRWDVFMEALPTILSKCSGIDFHPENADYPNPRRFWDFLNGREILVSSNKRDDYDLSINAESGEWTET